MFNIMSEPILTPSALLAIPHAETCSEYEKKLLKSSFLLFNYTALIYLPTPMGISAPK